MAESFDYSRDRAEQRLARQFAALAPRLSAIDERADRQTREIRQQVDACAALGDLWAHYDAAERCWSRSGGVPFLCVGEAR